MSSAHAFSITIDEQFALNLSSYFLMQTRLPGEIQFISVAPGNVASPGNVIIYGKCRTVAGKTPLPVYVALLTGNVAKKFAAGICRNIEGKCRNYY